MKNKSVTSILIVGLGQLGLPVAKYVKERGFETYGYDVNPKAMDFAEQTAAIKKAGLLLHYTYLLEDVSTYVIHLPP
jgi:UDP-N-acetyl-D-mannosaminuronic acid dehydrogenase